MILEGSREEARLAQLALADGLPDATVESRQDPMAFGQALAQGGWDVLIVAFRFPGGGASTVAEVARQESPHPAIVVLASPEELSEAWSTGFGSGLGSVVPRTPKGLLELPSVVRRLTMEVEERRSQSRLEKRLQTLLEQAGVGFFRGTLDGEMVEVNSTLLDLLGLDGLAAAEDLALPAPYFSRQSRGDLLNLVDAQGALHRQELELPKADGSTVWVDLTERLCLDAEGDLVIDGLVTDQTQRRVAEREISRRAEALDRSNQDLQRFAYVASHELQAPLRGIGKHCELLAEELADRLEGAEDESFRAIVEGVARMQKLIDDLLAFSRVESRARRPQRISCEDVVRKALVDLEASIEESGAEFAIEPLPTVNADPDQLRLLFDNLLGNAIKFRADAAPRIGIRSRRIDGGWELSVSDNGIGIEARDRAAIFDVFRRLHPEFPGSGIGLAIAKKIAERHGGRLWVESEPGVGSTFRFTLPASEKVDEEGSVEHAPASTVSRSESEAEGRP